MSSALQLSANSAPNVLRINISAVNFTFFSASAGINMVAPLIPMLQQIHGVGAATSSWLLVLPSVSMLVAASSVSRLSGRVGSGRATVAAAAVIAASLMLAAIPSFDALMASRLLLGLGNAALWTIGLTLLGGDTTSVRSRRIAGVMTSSALGAAAGPALSGSLADRFGLSVPFLIAGGCACVAALALAHSLGQVAATSATVLRTTAHGGDSTRSSRQATAAALRTPAVSAGTLTLAVSGAVVALLQFLVPVQLSTAGHSAQTVGLILSLGSLVFVLATALCIRIAPRLSSLRGNAVACALMAGALTPAIFSSDVAWLAAVSLLVVFPRAAIATGGYALVSHSHGRGGRGHSCILGVVNSLVAAATIAAPVLAGLVLDRLDIRWIYAAVAAAVGCAAAHLIHRSRVDLTTAHIVADGCGTRATEFHRSQAPQRRRYTRALFFGAVPLFRTSNE